MKCLIGTGIFFTYISLITCSLASNESLENWFTLLQKASHSDQLTLKSYFMWYDCGLAIDPIKMSSFKISPDPVVLPGNISISFNGLLQHDITPPIKMKIQLSYKVGLFWISIPCKEHVGSCTYEDICGVLEKECTPKIKAANMPCSCPILKGHYAVRNFKLPFPHPDDTPGGKYYLQVDLSHNNEHLACIQTYFKIVHVA